MSVPASDAVDATGERSVEEYEIRHGDYTAIVSSRAGALRKLTYRGRDLIVPFQKSSPIPDYRGIIAAPWPNRIADGSYRFDGHDLRLPINEAERDCALHGLAFGRDWELLHEDASVVALTVELEPSRGYPFALRLETTFTVDGSEGREPGLLWEVRATNVGDGTAPYGVCPHPYLLAGESPLDVWDLESPASRFLEVTTDRLLPVGEKSVDGHEFDFREARPIGATKIDHAFTAIGFDDAGTARVVLRDPAYGTAVAMEWDSTCPWVQIHTADKQPPAQNRLGLAVEPMTCPPDAFNSGTDLVRLEPGDSHTARWRIYGIGHG